MAEQGIDLSSNNPLPTVEEFKEVLKSGRNFLICKLTEGGGASSYVNPLAADCIENFKLAGGKNVGGYHYQHPTIPVLEQLGLIEAHFDAVNIVFDDSEIAEATWTGERTATQTMCEAIETRGKAGLYCNANFRGNMAGAPWGYPFWLAEYGPKASFPYTLWQFSQTGGVRGITGAVDLSVFQGSDAQLAALFGPKAKV